MSIKTVKFENLPTEGYVTIVWKHKGNLFSDCLYYKDNYFFEVNEDGTPSDFTYGPTAWLISNMENITFVVDCDTELAL